MEDIKGSALGEVHRIQACIGEYKKEEVSFWEESSSRTSLASWVLSIEGRKGTDLPLERAPYTVTCVGESPAHNGRQRCQCWDTYQRDKEPSY